MWRKNINFQTISKIFLLNNNYYFCSLKLNRITITQN